MSALPSTTPTTAPLAPFRIARVLVDVAAAELRSADDPTRPGLRLTGVEWQLLTTLGRDRGFVVPQSRLESVSGCATAGVRYHLSHIRAKLRHLDPDAPHWLEARVNLGYLLRRDPDQPRSGVPAIPETPEVSAVLLGLAGMAGMLAPPPETMGGAVLTSETR